jgi:hypothetical protein
MPRLGASRGGERQRGDHDQEERAHDGAF